MAFGQPLLLENVMEVVDPVLDPVLNKEIQRKGRNLVIQLADKEAEYTETFALFLCSKLPNPHFSPELSAQVTVIDFTVTMGGLEQQLLGRVVQAERAELEEQRQKLVADVNANQRTLKRLEDDLLYRLANSEGNLLDDTSLIEVLQLSKETSIEVKAKLETAAETDARISGAREEYRPVATRGSLLYFHTWRASTRCIKSVAASRKFDESTSVPHPLPRVKAYRQHRRVRHLSCDLLYAARLERHRTTGR